MLRGSWSPDARSGAAQDALGGGALEQEHQALTQEQQAMMHQHVLQLVQEAHPGHLPELQEMHGQLPA